MFIKRNQVNEFLYVEFREHPVVNFKDNKGTLFDISSEEFPTFAPDFTKDGNFNQQQYCICLINKTVTFTSIQLLRFLGYQSGQLLVPSQWLEDFSTLLKLNQDNPSIKAHQNKLDLVRSIVLDKFNQLTGEYIQDSKVIFPGDFYEDKRFCIVTLKKEVEAKKDLDDKRFLLLRRRTDYLQEVTADESSTFIKAIDMELTFWEATKTFNYVKKKSKRIIFKGSAKELAKIFKQLKEIKNKEGDLVFEGSTSDYSRLIVSNFSKVGGEPFSENSIRRYLSDYKIKIGSNEAKGLDVHFNLEKD